jgi:hypothetical protein
MPTPERKGPAKMPLTAEKRRPFTLWLTDTERSRVTSLARVKDDLAIGRKALMLGVSMLESGWSREASVAGGR